MTNTLVVNLFGGPGVSKSTTAALVFGKLKTSGVNAELVPEFAKDLTWEKRAYTLQHQTYVAAKQMYRAMRLFEQVDVIVTDSPLLLSLVYKGVDYTQKFEDFLLETFRSWRTLNFQLQRDTREHPYNQAGRQQTEAEAIVVDERIRDMLLANGIPVINQRVLPGEEAANQITGRVLAELRNA